MSSLRCPKCGRLTFSWSEARHVCPPAFRVGTEDPRLGGDDQDWFMERDFIYAYDEEAAAFAFVERWLSEEGHWNSDTPIYVLPLDGDDLSIIHVGYEIVPSFSVYDKDVVTWRPQEVYRCGECGKSAPSMPRQGEWGHECWAYTPEGVKLEECESFIDKAND